MSALSWGDLVKEAGTSGNSFEPLPDGDYDLKVVEATATTTASEKTMFKLKAQVQSGPHANRLIWDNLVVSPDNASALGFFFRKMAALGLTRDFFEQNPTNAQIEAALVNRPFRAKVGSRVWKDEARNELKEYYPARRDGVAPSAAPQAAPAPAPTPQVAAAPAPAPAPTPAAAPAPTSSASPWDTVAPAPAPVAAPPAPPF